MSNAGNEPNVKRPRSAATDDQENVPPTLSQATSDGLLAFFKAEYEKKLTETILLKQKNEEMEKSLKPLVLKRLLKLMEGSYWNGYTAMEEGETPTKLCLIDGKDLFINGVLAHPTKQLILEGLLSTCCADPFEVVAPCFDGDNKLISNLLKKVDTCNLTEFFLSYQNLSLYEYERLSDSGTIKNLYFDYVSIEYYKDAYIPLEVAIKKLHKLEKLAFGEVGNEGSTSITKETFKNLNEFPTFEKLQVFQLYDIMYEQFCADTFLIFKKKYPDTEFKLSFYSETNDDELSDENKVQVAGKEKAQLEALKQKLLPSSTTANNLEIIFD